jgi:YD repeat-containing protein
MAHDDPGLVTATTVDPGGLALTLAYTYDNVGRTLSTSNYNGAVGYSYDAAGRGTRVTSPEGTVSYEHNGVGQRTAMTLPGNRTVTYAYDSAGQRETVTDWNNRETSFTSTRDGLLATVTRDIGVTSAYAYDTADRLTAISHVDPGLTALAEDAYTLDANGNRTQVEVTGGAVTNATET